MAAPADATVAVLAGSLRDLAGTPADTRCDRVRVGTTGRPMTAGACSVQVRFDGRGVSVWLDPLVDRDVAGVADVVGTDVSVSAS